MVKKINNKIKQWQNKLLDTSRRNPLINFRAFKRTTIRIVDEKPAEVYRQLVINDEKFDFKSSDTQLEESSEGTNEEKDRSVEFDTYDKDSLRSKHIDNSLQTNLDINQLLKNLRRNTIRLRIFLMSKDIIVYF